MNKNWKTAFFLIIGSVGAGITLCGLTQASAHLFYVIGASCLLATAIYFKLTYFIALQLILIAGHGAVLLGIGPISQVVLPILLCLQFLAYYLLSGQLNNIFRLIGIAGIALLSIAFSYENQWVFFSGGLAIAIFSFYQVYHGRQVALLWAILNMIFMVISAIKIIN